MEKKDPKTITITIPYLPISLNRIFRMHKMERGKYFKKCKNDVWALTHEKGKSRPRNPYQKAKIVITFIFPDKGIRDFDNFLGGSKGVIDGIKAAKIIEDDCWRKLELHIRGEIGKPARTVIEIREIK